MVNSTRVPECRAANFSLVFVIGSCNDLRPSPAWTYLAVAKLGSELQEQNCQGRYDLQLHLQDNGCPGRCNALQRGGLNATHCTASSSRKFVDHPARVSVMGNLSRARGDPLTRFDVVRRMAHVLKRNPCARHVWVIETDVAYTGNWCHLLSWHSERRAETCVDKQIPSSWRHTSCQEQKENGLCSKSHNQYPHGYCMKTCGTCSGSLRDVVVDQMAAADLVAWLPFQGRRQGNHSLGRWEPLTGEALSNRLAQDPGWRRSVGNLVALGYKKILRVGLQLARLSRRLVLTALGALERGLVSKGEMLWPAVCLNELPSCQMARLDARFVGSPFHAGTSCASLENARVQMGKHPALLPTLPAFASSTEALRQREKDILGLRRFYNRIRDGNVTELQLSEGKLLHPWKWDVIMNESRWRTVRELAKGKLVCDTRSLGMDPWGGS